MEESEAPITSTVMDRARRLRHSGTGLEGGHATTSDEVEIGIDAGGHAGGTTVVVSICSTMAGPEKRLPDFSSSRS